MLISYPGAAFPPRFGLDGRADRRRPEVADTVAWRQCGLGGICRLGGNIWNVFCAYAKVATWPISTTSPSS
jgi:hypothetical protein